MLLCCIFKNCFSILHFTQTSRNIIDRTSLRTTQSGVGPAICGVCTGSSQSVKCDKVQKLMHSICIFSNVLQHLLMKYATDTHMKGAKVRAYLCTLQREWMMLCSGHTVTRQQRSMLHTWGISHSDNSRTVWEGNVKARRTDSGHTYTYECLSLSTLALKVLKSILHNANLQVSWGSETHPESRQMWHNHEMKMQAGRGQRMLYFARFSTAITCNKVLSMQFIDE